MKGKWFEKTDFEVRFEGDRSVIRGYVAKFDSLSEDLGGWQEKLAAGAFSPALRKSDTYVFWNHNADIVLGRKRNKTLQIKQDETGLFIRAFPAPSLNQYVEMIARGDVPYASFGFIAGADEWDHKKNIRTVTKIDELPEVSVGVPFPAYKKTDIAAGKRSMKTSLESTHSRSDQASIDHTHSRLVAYRLRQFRKRFKQQPGG